MSLINQSSVLTEVKSNKIILPSAEQLEMLLQTKISEMSNFQKCGNYIQAQKSKQSIEQLKKQLHERKTQDMVLRHKKEKKRMQKSQDEQIKQLNLFWEANMQQFKTESQKMRQQMQTRHEGEIDSGKKQLQSQISSKLKESSECLNLRKMQEQMAKQKQYTEAHKIQQRIIELEKKQKQLFQKQRQAKIETILSTLRIKQKAEKDALMKKSKAGQSQLLKDKQTQIQRVKHKNLNSIKELKSQQEKQVLSHKGQIKNKVTLSQCTSRSKLISVMKHSQYTKENSKINAN